MKSNEVEIAVAKLFGYRANIIVPNVSWGLPGLLHEADMLVLNKNSYLTEVEIKVSLSDLKADFKKKKFDPRAYQYFERNKIIRRMFYALPTKLMPFIDLIPIQFGIIEVKTVEGRNFASFVRMAKARKNILPVDNKTKMKLTELGCMRIWSLKDVIEQKNKENKDLRNNPHHYVR